MSLEIIKSKNIALYSSPIGSLSGLKEINSLYFGVKGFTFEKKIEVLKSTTICKAANSKAKRAFDFVVSALAIIALLPLLALISLLIVLDSKGAPIFSQWRTGLNGNKFKIYKFRTMKVMECGDKVVQARRNDNRITKLGAFLRRSSLDELPQLFNILKGEMSLIGPRPHALAHDKEFAQLIDEYPLRFAVKPGLTGLAQINGARGPTDTFEKIKSRVDYDIEYIANWALLRDIKIFYFTIITFVNHDAF